MRLDALPCQALFDHIFVDEFQDTDPLQAEIVLLLVGDGQHATHWRDVVSVRGKLTIVGDAKQSIYPASTQVPVMPRRLRSPHQRPHQAQGQGHP